MGKEGDMSKISLQTFIITLPSLLLLGFVVQQTWKKPLFPHLSATFLVEVTALNFLLGRKEKASLLDFSLITCVCPLLLSQLGTPLWNHMT